MKNKTKAELTEVINKLRRELSNALDDAYDSDQMNNRYDQGYNDGYQTCKNESREYISNSEMSDMPNVLRFG